MYKLLSISLFCVLLSAKAQASIKQDTVVYNCQGKTMKGIFVYNNKYKQKLPLVLVVHEWWGLTDYSVQRAQQLAKLGYAAFCIDMYGDDRKGNNPGEASKLASEVYGSNDVLKQRFEAGYQAAIKQPQVNAQQVAAIGYCFGGTVLLKAATMQVPLLGVVSFHGGLAGVQAATSPIQTKILVCHGLSDKFVSEADVKQFNQAMVDSKADVLFLSYANATHAFTNPQATAMGKQFNIPIAYNAKADKQSWKDMKSFLKKIFKA